MQGFIAELRRRNVLRVAAFYAAAGWLLVQVATQVFPFFDIPNWVVRAVVFAIVLGFPAALAFSWLYELTPEGLRLESEVDRTASIARQTGRKLDRLIIAVLSLAVVALAADKLAVHGRAPVADAAAPGAAADDKSIAVLPFESLSDDKSNSYFAEGIQDEILTQIAKVGALKVISRTSTQQYAARPGNLREIAQQLGVANVLEGSVQKAGNAVHINVQLIRAATDDHLWAESYNRKLDDIFGVEGEVAGAVAAALNAQLSGAERQAVASKPTDNVAAYDAYLRGRSLWGSNYDMTTVRASANAFGEAVSLDPGFALAWAQLSITAGFLYFNGVDQAHFTADFVRQASEKALQLQPRLGEAHLAHGLYLYRILRNFSAAHQEIDTARQLLPNSSVALESLGYVERRQGKWDEALGHLEQAALRDPHNAALMTSIGGETLSNMMRWDEDHAWLDRALLLESRAPLTLYYKLFAFQAQGRLEEAARMLDAIPAEGEDVLLAGGRGYQRLLEHRYDAATAEFAAALKLPDLGLSGLEPQMLYGLAVAQLRAGQDVQAKATFERVIEAIGPEGAGRIDDTTLPILLAQAYVGAGRREAAERQARHAIDVYANDSIRAPQAHEALALVLAWNGDLDGAMKELAGVQRTYGRTSAALLRLDPVWDPLRQDPRFQKLIADGEARERAVGGT